MEKQNLVSIVKKFGESGWDLIDAPAKEWLNATEKLNCALEQADKECGNCGCELDQLYKDALNILK